MKKLLSIVTILTFIFTACGEAPKENEMSREDRIAAINALENEVFGENGDFNSSKMLSLINNYDKFAFENPDDEMAPSYLFKAGDIAMGIEESERAIALFERVIENYPDFEKVPYCYFLRGFIYENNLNNLEKAKASYEEFISKFPDHEMTEGAKFSLKNLGKSPEELIREFEQSDSVSQEES